MNTQTAHKCTTCQDQLERCFIPGDGYIKTLRGLQVNFVVKLFRNSNHVEDWFVTACTGYKEKI
jgi:hypothetical protein